MQRMAWMRLWEQIPEGYRSNLGKGKAQRGAGSEMKIFSKKANSGNTAESYNGITDGVIWKQLLLFFFPLLFGTFFQMLYNTTDTIIVGRFVGTVALSAIGGAAAMIVNVVVGAFTGLSSGATVIIAQFYGAKDHGKVSKAVHTAIAISLLLGVIFTVAGFLTSGAMLKGMNTPEESYAQSKIYLQIYFLGMVPNLLYNTGAGILRAIGDSKRPLYYLIISTLANIVLDLLFVTAFHMGVAGAALATILCQLLSAVLVMQCLLRTKESYGVRIRKIRIYQGYPSRILKIGIPAMIQSLAYSITNVILQVAVNGYGTSYIAGWAACSKADQLFWMTSNSFGIAVTTFISQNYGAGKMARVKKCIKQSLIIDTIITISLSLFLWFASRLLLSLFTTDAEVVDLGFMMMHFFIPCYATFICVEIFSDVLRGLGDSVAPMIICVSGICILRILWVLFATKIRTGFDTIMWSYPVSWVPTSILLVVYYLMTWHRNGRLEVS